MTAAVVDALAALPDVPCMALVPHPRATVVHEPTGTRSVRRCVLPNGHGELGIPCSYRWFEEHVAVPIVDQDEVF